MSVSMCKAFLLSGKTINPKTNKKIKKCGKTYNELLFLCKKYNLLELVPELAPARKTLPREYVVKVGNKIVITTDKNLGS